MPTFSDCVKILWHSRFAHLHHSPNNPTTPHFIEVENPHIFDSFLPYLLKNHYLCSMTEDTFDIRSEQQAPAVTERDFENALRPLSFDDFTGQSKVVENLRIFVEAARRRGEPLDHTLLHGPPGLGKTTLSNIIANELQVGFKLTSGPVLDKPGDLAGLLTSLEPNDVLFIDEIHRLNPAVEEILYPAMEDFQLDLIIGEGPAARSVRIDLSPFTLVAATTRSGLLPNPLRDRFGFTGHLEFYDERELEQVIDRSARTLGVDLAPDALAEIARRSEGAMPAGETDPYRHRDDDE